MTVPFEAVPRDRVPTTLAAEGHESGNQPLTELFDESTPERGAEATQGTGQPQRQLTRPAKQTSEAIRQAGSLPAQRTSRTAFWRTERDRGLGNYPESFLSLSAGKSRNQSRRVAGTSLLRKNNKVNSRKSLGVSLGVGLTRLNAATALGTSVRRGSPSRRCCSPPRDRRDQHPGCLHPDVDRLRRSRVEVIKPGLLVKAVGIRIARTF